MYTISIVIHKLSHLFIQVWLEVLPVPSSFDSPTSGEIVFTARTKLQLKNLEMACYVLLTHCNRPGVDSRRTADVCWRCSNSLDICRIAMWWLPVPPLQGLNPEHFICTQTSSSSNPDIAILKSLTFYWVSLDWEWGENIPFLSNAALPQTLNRSTSFLCHNSHCELTIWRLVHILR